jgi:hypothetical protein
MSEKNMRTTVWMLAAGASLVCVAGAVQARTADPDQRALKKAVTAYLADHGDLCVGKFTWPRDVTLADQEGGSNDAVQMPVLEHLGLVESTEVRGESATTPTEADAAGGATAHGSQPQAATSGPIKRYSLTAKGRQFYLRKRMTTLGAHDRPIERDADFCVARLSLDKVVKWTPPEETHGHVETVVSYTYKVKSADWMVDPEARKVFPVVDRIIHGEGSALMTAILQVQNGKWVPVLPGQ